MPADRKARPLPRTALLGQSVSDPTTDRAIESIVDAVNRLEGMPDAAPELTVANNGSDVGTRPTLNLVPGTGIALTIADNGTADRVDVTITSSGGLGQPFGGNVVSPAAIAGATNDWNAFGGDSSASLIRGQTTGAAQDVTGLTGGAAGRVCVLFNIGNTGNLTLKRENAGSVAANRFTGPAGAGDIAVTPGNAVFLWYDGTSSRWRSI